MDLALLRNDALQRIHAAQDDAALVKLSQEFFGRKSGMLTEAMRELQSLAPAEKKERGSVLNALKKEIEDALAAKCLSLRRGDLQALAQKDALDVTMELSPHESGSLHPLPEFIRKVEEVFGRMGFDIADGPEVESEEYHFDLLNFPKNHPAREWADIFYIKDEGVPENRLLLRGHTSPVQIRYMQEHTPPFRMICPGKTYRKDADATHSPMFHQFEGLMIGEDVSLRHMKGIMIAAMKELLSSDLEFRFRTGYFPFVEPGLEMDVRWQGEKKTREGDWLEVVGCGMVHPNVLKNVGIDPARWQGFAFGFGIERLVMIKHQIPDIRLFYQGDVRFLRQFA